MRLVKIGKHILVCLVMSGFGFLIAYRAGSFTKDKIFYDKKFYDNFYNSILTEATEYAKEDNSNLMAIAELDVETKREPNLVSLTKEESKPINDKKELSEPVKEEVEEKKEENSNKNNSSTNTSNKTSSSNKNNSSTNNKNSTSNKSTTSNNSSNSNSSGSGSTTSKEANKLENEIKEEVEEKKEENSTKNNSTNTSNKTSSSSGSYDDKEASKALDLMNKERKKSGASNLTWNEELEQYAKQRAIELQKSFSHTRPNGKSSTGSSNFLGETLGKGQWYASEIIEDWMYSPEHKKTMLNTNYKTVGIAFFKIGKSYYWVAIYGK